MAGDLSQDGRMGSLETPLGKDVLVLSRFDANEALGGLFAYNIEALSEQQNIDFNQLLGLNLSVKIKTVDQLERYFNGVLVQARWTGARDDIYVYQLVLMPWLWLLSHTSDCRIFSSMKVPDIITQVFQDRGFSDFVLRLTGTYPTLEYCVQYRESDMNFVCRLMEEYGIYYFFEHTEDKHTLVLVDSKSGHKPIPGLAPVPYLPAADRARRDKQQFDNWSTFRGFQSGRFVLNDYDYEKPSANLIADADHSGGYAHGSMEMYDYPGRYDDQGEGKTLAKVRLEADQAKDQRRVAHGITPSLFPGGTMTLERHPADSENIEYLVLRASHSYSAQGYRSGGGGDGAYTGSYEMASSERPFRSPLLTRKSVIQGPQTAKVVGQQGEEIDVDKEGRILVQFYWDRKKKTSRRVRVGQIWAGKYQRALFIPRIGDEVVVQYLEGDPDRPMVVGCVYNADNTPPTTLPDNKTQSGINSESSKGHSGYNHLVFEDKAGQEWLKVRAQKDLIVHALNDETRNIDVDQTEKIGNNVTKSVGNNETINVGATYSLTAVQEIVLTVGMSSLTITPGSITLSSPTITFTATSVLSSTAPATSIVADGMLSLTSAAIALNGPTVVQPGLAVNGAMAWTSAVGPPPVPAPAA